MSAARQRRYMARLNADPHRRAEYLMKYRQWGKKQEDGRCVTSYEKLLRTTQHEKCNEASLVMVKGETGHEEMCGEGAVGMRCMLPLSPLYCDSFWTDGLW